MRYNYFLTKLFFKITYCKNKYKYNNIIILIYFLLLLTYFITFFLTFLFLLFFFFLSKGSLSSVRTSECSRPISDDGMQDLDNYGSKKYFTLAFWKQRQGINSKLTGETTRLIFSYQFITLVIYSTWSKALWNKHA